MNKVFVLKNDVVVHSEVLQKKDRKKQLGSLYRKYGTNRLFTYGLADGATKPTWHRVEFVWNSSCTDIKRAHMYFLTVKDLPKVLQMMVLVGAA